VGLATAHWWRTQDQLRIVYPGPGEPVFGVDGTKVLNAPPIYSRFKITPPYEIPGWSPETNPVVVFIGILQEDPR